MISPVKYKILIHSLSYQFYLSRLVLVEGCDHDVTVVSTEVVAEDRNLVFCSQLDIAHAVCGTSIFAGYVIVVSHFVHEFAEYVSLEGIVADGAFVCRIEVFDIRKRHDEALAIEEVCLALVLDLN